MEIGDLYQVVLMLVLVGMIIGVGVIVLEKFGASTGVSAGASGYINNSVTAIGSVASDWLSLIVIIAVMSIILGLVLRSFSGRK